MSNIMVDAIPKITAYNPDAITIKASPALWPFLERRYIDPSQSTQPHRNDINKDVNTLKNRRPRQKLPNHMKIGVRIISIPPIFPGNIDAIMVK